MEMRPVRGIEMRVVVIVEGISDKYARLLIEALDLARVPRALDGVLVHVERLIALGECHSRAQN
jgi:hypothetical protein